MEPEACVAYFEGEGDDAQLVVIGRSINIHKHLDMLQEGLDWENMRYEEAFVGGQFGMKLDITSEGMAAAAAVALRRPVRYIPSLVESMQMTSKRHALTSDVSAGRRRRGRITAYRNHMLVDNGAYMSNGEGSAGPHPLHALRLVPHPQCRGSGATGLYQQPLGLGRQGSRAAAGQLRAGKRDGHARPQAGHRPARIPPAQLAGTWGRPSPPARWWRSGRSRASARRSSPTTRGPLREAGGHRTGTRQARRGHRRRLVRHRRRGRPWASWPWSSTPTTA